MSTRSSYGASPRILAFRGYGKGATFTQIDATHWHIQSANHLISEIITLSNAATINVVTDVTFGA